ncbi:MAG: hypothetical protein LBQ24_03880 [Candidatus Peribacteria bacterium]|jgi:hypothetical protein|nr:hypothetical protein [Candidatus Peribacteria bacterium]
MYHSPGMPPPEDGKFFRYGEIIALFLSVEMLIRRDSDLMDPEIEKLLNSIRSFILSISRHKEEGEQEKS